MGRRHHVASQKCTDGKQDNAGSIQVTIEPKHTELNTCNLLSQTGALTQGVDCCEGASLPSDKSIWDRTATAQGGQQCHRPGP